MLFSHGWGLPGQSLKDGLDMAIHQWHWGNVVYCLLQASWHTEHFEFDEILFGRWSWNGHRLMVKTLYIHYSGLLRDRPLWVSRVVLRRWSWNGCLLVHKTTYSLFKSPWDTDLCESVEVYLDDGLEIAIHWYRWLHIHCEWETYIYIWTCPV